MSRKDPDPDLDSARFNCPPDPGSGSVIQDYRSGDLDPKEIFTDLQHCFLLPCWLIFLCTVMPIVPEDTDQIKFTIMYAP
jgi:hypothetical protein